MRNQRRLDLVLLTRVGGAEEIEQVRTLNTCAANGCRQGPLEVVKCPPVSRMEPACDLDREDVARLALLDGASGVPEALGTIGQLVE